MRLYSLLFIAVMVTGTIATCNLCDLKPISLKTIIPDVSFSLNGANLGWPCRSTQDIYMKSGRYNSSNVIATRFQKCKDHVVVAMPRYKCGVPFTLGKFCPKYSCGFTKVMPFPCWAIQEEGNCHALQNVVDLALDRQGVLWVLDVGIVNTLEQPIRRCPPKIVGLDSKNGFVVKVIDLSSLVTSVSRLQYLAIDYTSDGKPFAYISDATTRAIIVYNINADKGHRVVLPKAVAAGCTKNDVLYIALIRKPLANFVYFTYLGSTRLFYIKSADLQQGKKTGSLVSVGTKPHGDHIVLLGTDNGYNLFFRVKGQSSIYMWNTKTTFKSENWLLAQNGDDCRLPTQVVPGFRKAMWVMESNFQDYIANNVGCMGASVVVHPLVKDCEC